MCEKLSHRHHVEHLRVHGDQDCSRGAERGQCQKAELRRAVDHNDIVERSRFGERLRDPTQKRSYPRTPSA